MAGQAWNPDQYERFRSERQQPYFDLLALVRPALGMRVVDLGCGTGELTRELHQRLAARETVGIDGSEAMLERSRAFAGDGLCFERGDIATFAADHRWDLVFSNAALQWVPGHEALLTRLAGALTDRGQLAFQVPANDDAPSHLVAAEVAGEEPFRCALGGDVRQLTLLEPVEYARLLDRLGFREQHVRLQVYGHHLRDRDEVIEWVKGSLLGHYRQRLPPALYQAFEARYRERLLPRLDDARPYFFPFRRILCWAHR
jgi:trans-aconitate 2-methyltransferase